MELQKKMTRKSCLSVNPTKSELMLVNPASSLCRKAPESFNSVMQGIKIILNSDLKLLGAAPIQVGAIKNMLEDKKYLSIKLGKKCLVNLSFKIFYSHQTHVKKRLDF